MPVDSTLETADLRRHSHYTIDLLWNTGFGSSFVVTHVCAGFSLSRPPGKCLLYLRFEHRKRSPFRFFSRYFSFHDDSLRILKVNALDR